MLEALAGCGCCAEVVLLLVDEANDEDPEEPSEGEAGGRL